VNFKQFARMVSGGRSFLDRQQAGQELGAALREQLGQQLGQQQELCVFGLVRGGKTCLLRVLR
jgi:predicted phosphoribosyltransferase